MAYSPELVAQIRRLHFYEHYTLYAVSKAVGLHRDTVRRILYGDDQPESEVQRARITDPYLDTIKSHLDQYPSIRSTTLIRILRDRGYSGSLSSLRRVLAPLRKKKNRSFQPMSVFQGQQAQVDWAHFGSLKVNKGERKLYLFVMVLSWSRAVFAKFTFDQKTDSFLRLHEEAFEYFGGAPKEILYDNLKSAVLERFKDKIKFNPQLVEFSGFYGYEPRACKPYSGNQKGRVERTIRFIREDFSVTANFDDITTLNEQLSQWLKEVALSKPWPDNSDYTVGERLAKEREFLRQTDSNKINPKYSGLIRSDKVGLVRFDLNDYSIPWQYVREQLSLVADDFKVQFYYKDKLICHHQRSWNRHTRIIDPTHYQNRPEFAAESIDHIISKYPDLEDFYRVLVDRGESLASIKRQFINLYDMYRGEIFVKSLRIARKKKMYHPSQVSRIAVGLEKQNPSSPTPVVKLKEGVPDIDIKSHSLETYDYF